MKRLLFLCCFFSVFICINSFAQEKVKTKEDKTKLKDKDANYKDKEKEDKTKIKDGDSKVKAKPGDANNMNKDMMNKDMSTSYTANYSSNFAMGNPAHSKMILDLWKDWDDNAFNRHDYMADTVVMLFPDGTSVKGKDSSLAGAMRYRGSMASAKSTLDAWIPLRSTDRNEDWVAIWGTETDTYADGKTAKKDLHEIWRINKDGKVDFMKQFAATPQPPPPPKQ